MFPDVQADSTSYTFRHDQGLLFATQFAQPLLVLMEMAQYIDLKAKQLVPQEANFAGHSLGEYAALSSVAEVLSLESLMDIVFIRGMTMQAVVERKADGSSDFAMVAANPTRVHKKFTPQMLVEAMAALDSPNKLLQIVNYNVEPLQYVIAG